jgi:hypothetical protein
MKEIEYFPYCKQIKCYNCNTIYPEQEYLDQPKDELGMIFCYECQLENTNDVYNNKLSMDEFLKNYEEWFV